LGRTLPCGLWQAAQTGLRIGSVSSETTNENEEEPWVQDGEGTPAATLLRKLRWSSIGLIYDWTRRIYVSKWGFVPLPEELATLAKKLVHLASLTSSDSQNLIEKTATPAPIFTPDAALINYYHEGDTLNGHIDDAEPDMTQPLVSLSIGRPCVFLIGGFSRDVEPIPVLLRSGDAVILAGDSRRSYHGVPRIFPLKLKVNELAIEEERVETQENRNGSLVEYGEKKDKLLQRDLLAPECELTDWGEHTDADFSPFEQHMNGSRINISIRSVGGGGG
jgi:DNA alkylation damage repair protein AlkB